MRDFVSLLDKQWQNPLLTNTIRETAELSAPSARWLYVRQNQQRNNKITLLVLQNKTAEETLRERNPGEDEIHSSHRKMMKQDLKATRAGKWLSISSRALNKGTKASAAPNLHNIYNMRLVHKQRDCFCVFQAWIINQFLKLIWKYFLLRRS